MLRAKPLIDKINSEVVKLKSLLPFTHEVKAMLDKKFRLEFNYNSNHLEGNTLTYSETELLLIFDQTDGGHEYREYQEMQAHDVTLLMIQQEAQDKERPLTEQFIRNLNEHLLVKEFWKDAITADGHKTRKKIVPGEYKTTPNSVLLNNGEIFHYTSPADVPNEMAKLVEWFNTNKELIDTLTLAATLHYKFVRIHPFDDGNGRTARLLMNYVLLCNHLPIIVIKSEEKKEYLAALNRADAGDISYFNDYVGNQLLWSLDISIKAANGESIDEHDDVDKEIDLLIKELHQIPDEYDKKRDLLEVTDVLINSVYPLLIELDLKLSRIQELFVDSKIEVLTTESDEMGEDKIYSIDIESANRNLANGLYIYREEIISMEISIELDALKKARSITNFQYTLPIRLGEYHYFIDGVDGQKDLIKLSYGRFLGEDHINKIIKNVVHKIIFDIKEATNPN